MNDSLLKIRGVKKVYGTNIVLHDIDMDIYTGEIIGLIGENGAGKSTILKIIAGVERSTEGTIEIRGKPFICNSLLQANMHGVGMVFQEQSLIGNLTVAQNIYLGREKTFSKEGFIDWGKMNEAAKNALKNIGIEDVQPTAVVRNLTFATRQMVEIAKVLDVLSKTNERALLLLDEPTTVLSTAEIQNLFAQIRKVKESGNSIIFVSHRLDEVLEISDRIYIFKDGENIGDVIAKDADKDMLYERMVQRETSSEYYQTNHQTIPNDEVVMRVESLSKFGEFKNVSFELHKGEILGICGVEGSGNESVCSILCGDDIPTKGKIYLNNKRVDFSSPTDALDKGVLLIPKERRDEGIIDILSVKENIILSSLKHFVKFGVLQKSKITNVAQKWVKSMGIKCIDINEDIGRLSGGNAQKVIFARAMNSQCPILILNHPTRGVDVGAKEEIYKIIREMTEKGTAMVLLGDTLDEYIGLSSRIIVMKDGLVCHEFKCDAKDKPEQVDIIKYMM
jgi:ribose transport system ATP-binding protein